MIKKFPILVGHHYSCNRCNDEFVPWEVAEKAYEEYSAKHGTNQSLGKLAERGGFSKMELIAHLYGWIVRNESGVVYDMFAKIEGSDNL